MRVLALGLIGSMPAFTGPPEIVDARAILQGDAWRFDVTMNHADTGWDHYADGWGVYLPDGTELGCRVLAHPHVNEMPFTRSLSGVVVPNDARFVLIRPRDSVHGEGAEFELMLER